jgi:hypothetical protein
MKTISITPTTSEQARLRGLALASVIIALMLSLLLEALDQTIVGTAMPRIIAQLHGLDHYTWMVTAYVLASMTIVPIVGKLSDQFGRRPSQAPATPDTAGAPRTPPGRLNWRATGSARSPAHPAQPPRLVVFPPAH